VHTAPEAGGDAIAPGAVWGKLTLDMHYAMVACSVQSRLEIKNDVVDALVAATGVARARVDVLWDLRNDRSWFSLTCVVSQIGSTLP